MFGTVLVEMELEIAQCDRVVFVELGWLVDEAAVYQGPVPALEILEKVVPVALEDLGVVSADSLVVEHDVAAGVSAENGSFVFEFAQIPGSAVLLGGEIGQCCTFGWAAGLAVPIE